MSTKYGSQISPRSRWATRGEDRPRLSDHLVGGPTEDGPGRWCERTPPDAVAPETAWVRGQDAHESVRPWFAGRRQSTPDRVRWYAADSEYCGRWIVGIVVVEEATEEVPVTVVRADEWDDPARRSYAYSRADEVIDG